MANYTPTFTKPYPSGWVDKPSKATPVTAANMNSYDTAIAALEAYLRDNAIKNVSADTTVKSGTKIATITIDGTEYVIYSPSVSYESAITGGTKVGTITVGTNTFDVYAPTSSAGGSTVSVVPKTLTGTNIAEITVDGTTYQLYAPTSGGSGSAVTAESTLTEGTQIGKITIDGVETILYAPTESPITVDSELSATSENAVQNKAIAEEFQKYANGTKVVAKATEAETAKTAASATTAQSATTAESATKATQDAQGNVIDTTYAKKTEVPQVTVVDNALSSTSTNPVQNKVVKAEFDNVNSNLTALNNSKLKGYTVEYNVPANSGGWHKIAQITGGYFNFDLYATGSWSNQRKSNAHFQIQNTEGIVRIVQLSGLADTGGGIRKIRMIRVVDDKSTWILEEHSNSSTNGELFRFTIAGDVTVTPFDGSVDTTTDFKDSVSLTVSDIPTGTVINTSNVDSTLSSTSINPVQNKVVKTEFDKVKNDLDKLNSLPIGSIIQIEEDKDNIETTTQKYGWQYLGKSNIQYEIGSTNILVTHVYRKNN